MAKPESESSKPNGNGREQPSGRGLRRPQQRGAWLGRGRPLNQFRTEFDRLFDELFGRWPALSDRPDESQSRWGIDIDDVNDKVVVRAEAPGFEPSDFDIQVRDNQLQLCACQSGEESKEDESQWHRQELYRSIPLQSGIDQEHVEAQYRNGVLTITIPKTEEARPKRIEVKS